MTATELAHDTLRLRPYQTEALAAIRKEWADGNRDTLLVMATGGGKTACFLHLILEEIAHSGRALILAHRRELIDQPYERIQQWWPEWLWRTGIIMADVDQCDRPLTLASIQTLAQPHRLKRLLRNGTIDYIVTDEAHHACSPTYVKVIEAIREDNPGLKHLGVTATPVRHDGDGLKKIYQSVAAKYDIKVLVSQAWLVPPRWLAIQTGLSTKSVQTRNGDFVDKQLANVYDTDNCHELVAETHKRYTQGRKALAFTASVAAAYHLAEACNAIGINAIALDGTTPKEERKQRLRDFRHGRYEILANCSVLTEGFDLPEIEVVHQVRPTKSDGLYLQMLGRALRPVPGKSEAIILDYVPMETRNLALLGDILGVPAEQTLKRKVVEKGEVQGGFTFDGNLSGLLGDPNELMTRTLNYLDISPFAWDRHGDWLLLGLGRGRDETDRMLAISPLGEADTQQLIGLYKRRGKGWQGYVILESDNAVTLTEAANRLAEKHGHRALIAKDAKWMKAPMSDQQRDFLLKLAGKSTEINIEGLTRGAAAKQISFLQARRTLQQVGLWR